LILSRIINLQGLDQLLQPDAKIEFPGCQHDERLELLKATADRVQKGYTLYKELKLQTQYPISSSDLPSTVLTHIANSTFSGIEGYQTARLQISRAMVMCKTCISRRKSPNDHSSQIKSLGRSLVLNRRHHQKEEKEDNHDYDGDGDDEDQKDPEGGSGGEEGSNVELQKLALNIGGKVVKSRKATKSQSRPVQPYTFQEEEFTGVVKDFDPQFDSYHTGPVVEALIQIKTQVYGEFSTNPANTRGNTHWGQGGIYTVVTC
jgi:hypothetical protein